MSKPGNPAWTKGVSGNPKGRKPQHFGKYLRDHPSIPTVLEKIIGAALDDDDPRQKDAWKLIANKIAPDLKSQEIQAAVSSHIGVIALPSKKDLDPTPLPSINDPSISSPQKKLVAPEKVPQKKGTSEIGVPKQLNGTKGKI